MPPSIHPSIRNKLRFRELGLLTQNLERAEPDWKPTSDCYNGNVHQHHPPKHSRRQKGGEPPPRRQAGGQVYQRQHLEICVLPYNACACYSTFYIMPMLIWISKNFPAIFKSHECSGKGLPRLWEALLQSVPQTPFSMSDVGYFRDLSSALD